MVPKLVWWSRLDTRLGSHPDCLSGRTRSQKSVCCILSGQICQLSQALQGTSVPQDPKQQSACQPRMAASPRASRQKCPNSGVEMDSVTSRKHSQQPGLGDWTGRRRSLTGAQSPLWTSTMHWLSTHRPSREKASQPPDPEGDLPSTVKASQPPDPGGDLPSTVKAL